MMDDFGILDDHSILILSTRIKSISIKTNCCHERKNEIEIEISINNIKKQHLNFLFFFLEICLYLYIFEIRFICFLC